MNGISTNSRVGEINDSKFTKEYKSPQHSRFKMASFTEIVKTKTKVPKINGTTSNAKNILSNSKVQPRYTYLSSTMKKPKIKAVKHQEIYLDQKNKADQRYRIPKKKTAPKKTISNRKATSNQKERIKSSKFTSGILGRDSSGFKGFRSTDRLLSKRVLSNQHSK